MTYGDREERKKRQPFGEAAYLSEKNSLVTTFRVAPQRCSYPHYLWQRYEIVRNFANI